MSLALPWLEGVMPSSSISRELSNTIAATASTLQAVYDAPTTLAGDTIAFTYSPSSTAPYTGMSPMSSYGLLVNKAIRIVCDAVVPLYTGTPSARAPCQFDGNNERGGLNVKDNFEGVGLDFYRSRGPSTGTGEGGGIYAAMGSSSPVLTLVACSFRENSTYRTSGAFGGGGIYVGEATSSLSGATTVNLRDCTFSNCAAGAGGAIYLNNQSGKGINCNIIGCTFANNKALYTASTAGLPGFGGGAIAAVTATSINIYGSYFTLNTAVKAADGNDISVSKASTSSVPCALVIDPGCAPAFCGGSAGACGYTSAVASVGLALGLSAPGVGATATCALTATAGAKSFFCPICSAGKYLLSSSAAEQCAACPAGKAGSTDNLGSNHDSVSDCVSCAVGKYAATSGMSQCTTCASGTYADAVGSIICADCSPGKAGIYTMEGVSSPEDAIPICQVCPAHTYSATAGLAYCSYCVSGKTSAAGATECTTPTYSCQPGSYLSAADTCAPCGAGRYTAWINADTSCTVCGAGSYTSDTSSVSCSYCPPNTYLEDTGLSNDSTAHDSSLDCLSCPAGKTNPGGAGFCTNLPCSPGKYATNNVCSSCKPGTYTNSMNSVLECNICDKGSYTVSEGSTSCALCPANTFNADWGTSSSLHDEATDCTACPTGKISVAGSKFCGYGDNVPPVGVAYLLPYPGYSGSTVATGFVLISQTANGISLSGFLTSSEHNVSGGLHVHSVATKASDCAAAGVGGHYYTGSTDPWDSSSKYTTDATGSSSFDHPEVVGYTLNGASLPVDGLAVVMHNSSGEKVACGTISLKSRLEVAKIAPYPEYTGSLSVQGLVLFEVLDYPIFGSVQTTAIASGLTGQTKFSAHVHTGTSCAVAQNVGGHLYTATDAWTSSYSFPIPSPYVPMPEGGGAGYYIVSGETFSYDGAPLNIHGRAAVMHDASGARVGCGVLTAMYGVKGSGGATTVSPTQRPSSSPTSSPTVSPTSRPTSMPTFVQNFSPPALEMSFVIVNNFPGSLDDETICSLAEDSLCAFIKMSFDSTSRTMSGCKAVDCEVALLPLARRSLGQSEEVKKGADVDMIVEFESSKSELDIDASDVWTALVDRKDDFNDIYVSVAEERAPDVTIGPPSAITEASFAGNGVYSPPSSQSLVRQSPAISAAVAGLVLGLLLALVGCALRIREACSASGGRQRGPTVVYRDTTNPIAGKKSVHKYSKEGAADFGENPML